jgi:hypothetical protein
MWCAKGPLAGHLTRSLFDRYNILSEDDLRRTTMYVDSLPIRREVGTKTNTYGVTRYQPG